MPNQSTNQSNVITIGETSSKLISPDAVLARVDNLVPTPEGGYAVPPTLRPYLPKPTTGGPPDSGAAATISPLQYGPTKGVFHLRTKEGQRDIMLLHTGDQIWEFTGWSRSWRCLVGPAGANPALEAPLIPEELSDFPTQFVSTPTGVVIIPQGSRALFYDGEVIAPLGYDAPPAAPIGYGPESSSDSYNGLSMTCGVNDSGYCLDSLTGRTNSKMSYPFRRGRVGTVQTPASVSVSSPEDGSQVIGYLMPARYRAKAQFIDRWGNLSPLSGPSNDVVFERQPATGWAPGAPNTCFWVNVDAVLKQIAWDSIPNGPGATVGKILYRTRDLVNSGTASYFELPLNSQAVVGAFATIPDNVTETYPDNVPDAWLGAEPVEVDPVPMFRLAAMAFGRLWVANAPAGQEGMLRASMIGRWGTMESGMVIYPDPNGAEITGLHAVNRGLLVMTERSVFLVSINDAGDDFQVQPLSFSAGCAAPASIKTIGNGVVVWLGRDGFYAYDGETVASIFDAHRDAAIKFNPAALRRAVATFNVKTGQYMCWLAGSGSTHNDTAWVYDGIGWHTRSGFRVTGACSTEDHRRLVLVSGQVLTGSGLLATWKNGVFVLDHGEAGSTGTLETCWLRNTASDKRSSVRRIRLWLRERGESSTASDRVQVEASIDYRAEVVSSGSVERYPEVADGYADPPAFLNSGDVWGSAVWRRRRPYWANVDLDLASCEVFRLRITCPSRFEILGFVFEDVPRDSSGARRF